MFKLWYQVHYLNQFGVWIPWGGSCPIEFYSPARARDAANNVLVMTGVQDVMVVKVESSEYTDLATRTEMRMTSFTALPLLV